METKEKGRVLQQRQSNIVHEALTMALAILVERIQSLSKDDREDLYELMKDLPSAENEEELDSIVTTMREILDQEPVRLVPIDQFSEDKPGVGLQKWIDYVSGKLRELRKQKGLTQEQLAISTGLPQSHISRLESGKHSPSRITLEKIAKALDVDVSLFDPSA